ncbi:hypothetical protein V6N13_068903 [Hibiscus sabdariffa]|uniref:Clp R domain-containing protein n=1 Tax=Hibiscus sabdariffa TaxID=183260 RepID=A0ABR2QP48_9ROSI
MMARVVAQSALRTTTAHTHCPSHGSKSSVKMAYGLQTPVLRKSFDLRMTRFGHYLRCPITISSPSRLGCAKFEGFTREAIEAIMLAREESRRLRDDSVGTEHILLGLTCGGTSSIAAKALKSLGIELEHVRKHVTMYSDRYFGGDSIDHLAFEFNRVSIRSLVRSFEAARRLGHNYIGPEHLLLGLVLEEYDDEPLNLALRDQGVSSSSFYRQVICMAGEGNNVSVVTTLPEYSKHIGEDSAPATIKVPESSSVEETIIILKTLTEYYEIHHRLCYDRDAFVTAAELSDRYISDGFLPDKAIDLFDKAGALVSSRHAELFEVVRELGAELRQIIKSNREAGPSLNLDKLRESHDREMELRFQIHMFREMSEAERLVTEVDLKGIVSSWTGIPMEKLVTDKSDRLLKIEESLRKRVVGRDEAVKAVSSCVHRRLDGFMSNYPIVSFVFYGPTGVGKLELAKALAANYFGSEEAVIQLDMREFMESHTLSKLIGSSFEAGQLIEYVRSRPHSVVLLKDIEKAHLDVLNAIRQIIDGKETIVDFRNTFLIMTCKAGSNVIEKGERQMGFDLDEHCPYNTIKSLVIEELKQRLGLKLMDFLSVIVFRRLTELEVKEIADIKLKEASDRLKAKEIQLHVTRGFRDRVVEQGYDSSRGAMPLRRAIRLVEDSVAEKMVAREIKKGDSVTVDVDLDGNVVLLNGSNHWLIQNCTMSQVV